MSGHDETTRYDQFDIGAYDQAMKRLNKDMRKTNVLDLSFDQKCSRIRWDLVNAFGAHYCNLHCDTPMMVLGDVDLQAAIRQVTEILGVLCAVRSERDKIIANGLVKAPEESDGA